MPGQLRESEPLRLTLQLTKLTKLIQGPHSPCMQYSINKATFMRLSPSSPRAARQSTRSFVSCVACMIRP